MAAVTFDTLKFVKTLKEAGVLESQAKAFSTVVQESHETSELATRGDLRELETNLCHEIKELELCVDTRFEKVHGEMLLLKWMLGLLIAGVTSLVLKAFFDA